MALSDVVTDIHAQLVQVDSGIATAQPSVLLGGRYLSEQATPPRVVWVAVRGKPGALDPRGTTPRAFGSRYLDVACHIWGADPTATEVLLNNVHNSARLSLGSGARWLSEDWPQQDGGEIEQLGTLVIVVFEFRIPITEVGQATYVVPAVQQTLEVDFPDGQVKTGSPMP